MGTERQAIGVQQEAAPALPEHPLLHVQRCMEQYNGGHDRPEQRRGGPYGHVPLAQVGSPCPLKPNAYETDNLDMYPAAVYRHPEGTGTERPGTGGHDPALYRKGGEGTEKPGEGHADADHGTSMDERGSGGHDRPAEGVQQLPELVPLDCLLRGTDLRLLPRNSEADGQHGRLYQTAGP